MKTSLLSMMFAITASTAFGQYVHSKNFSQEFQRNVVQSVVHIHDLTTGCRGTGYAVGQTIHGDYVVLTGNHVISESRGAMKGHHYPFDSSSWTSAMSIVAQDIESDLALLVVRTASPIGMIQVMSPNWKVIDHAPVMAVGFPAGVLTCHESSLVKQDHFESSEHGVDGQFLRVADRAQPGISGSPLVVSSPDGTPFVIGTWWGFSGQYGITSSPVEMQNFLYQLGYSYIYDVSPNQHQRYLANFQGGGQTPTKPAPSEDRLAQLFRTISAELYSIQSENR